MIQWYENLFKRFSPSHFEVEQVADNIRKSLGDTTLFAKFLSFATSSGKEILTDRLCKHYICILHKMKMGGIAENLVLLRIQMMAFFKGVQYASCALTTALGKRDPFPYCKEMALQFLKFFSLLDAEDLSELFINLVEREQAIIIKGYKAMHSLEVKFKSRVKKVRENKNTQEKLDITLSKSHEAFYNELCKEKEFVEPYIKILEELIEFKKTTPGKSNNIKACFGSLFFDDVAILWQNVGKLYSDSFIEGEFDYIKALKNVYKHDLIKLKRIDIKEVEILDGIAGKSFNISYDFLNGRIKVESK